MNKLAIAAAVLLAIVFLVLPRVVGSVTEARVVERVAAIDANPSAAAELLSFERGWFRSRARIELGFVPETVAQAADAAGTPLGAFAELPVVVDFAHGPLAVLDGLYLGWAKMVARPDIDGPGVSELTETLGVPYLFEFRGRSGLFGGLVFDADAPAFELPIGEALLAFSGAALVGRFDDPRLDARAEVGSVALTSPTGAFAVRGVAAAVDNELRSRYVLPGQASLSVERISAGDSVDDASPVLEATNLQVRSDTALDAANELLEMRMSYAVDALRLSDNDFADAALGTTVRNLDAAAVEAYGAAATDAAAAGADPAAVAAALGPHLERALKASPSLTLEPIRFRYEDEPFEGRVEITTNTARLPPAGTLGLDNPLLLLGLLNANAELRLSKVLAGHLALTAARIQLAGAGDVPPDQQEYMAEAQSGLLLATLIGQGVLIEDGDDYVSSIQYTDGGLTLNGNALPFGLQ